MKTKRQKTYEKLRLCNAWMASVVILDRTLDHLGWSCVMIKEHWIHKQILHKQHWGLISQTVNSWKNLMMKIMKKMRIS